MTTNTRRAQQPSGLKRCIGQKKDKQKQKDPWFAPQPGQERQTNNNWTEMLLAQQGWSRRKIIEDSTSLLLNGDGGVMVGC